MRSSPCGFGEMDDRDRALIALVKREGSVYHVLGCTPDQAEDLYVILVDDGSVVSFRVCHIVLRR
jgi:hypothetical protein